MKILVTGAAGFIGFHLVKKLASMKGMEIVGLDNLNQYYDIKLKYARLELSKYSNYKFICQSITNAEALRDIFSEEQFDIVINMAAQAGVRYSIENPQSYVESNIQGFTNMLECCRSFHIKHLIYASSSSVYGMNNKTPFSEDDNVDYPVSFYAATKKANELMAHTYSHIHQLPTTGVRLFTVYGPWGRPDMSPILFATAIMKGEPIKLFNNGDMLRDFTFVNDIAEGIIRLIDCVPDTTLEHPFYRILNIGNSTPVQLLHFIETLEEALGKKAKLVKLPMQPGDVKVTYADTSKLEALTGFKPSTRLEEGIRIFAEWFKEYYRF